jgi:hypothetical protein
MSNLSKSANPNSVDAAMEMAEQMEGRKSAPLAKPSGRGKLSAPAKLADISFSAKAPTARQEPTEVIREQGQGLGERIIVNNANAFNEGVVRGAGSAMAQARSATEQLVAEVDQQSAAYFQQLAEGYGS